MKNNKWNNNQIQILKEKYPYEKWHILEHLLHPFKRSDIIKKASNLKIKRENYFYSQEQIDFLKLNYNTHSNKKLCSILNKSASSISSKAIELGLCNNRDWTIEEIEYLKIHYPYKSNIQISKILKRGSESIGCKARSLKLYKIKFTYYDLDEFINNLKNYANTLNRTPFCHEVCEQSWSPSLMSINRYFGGYRKVCEIANLDINANIFGKSYPAYRSWNDDLCWSKSEMIVTNFFIENNIRYRKEIYYNEYIKIEECKYKICDWIIGDNVFVEYFGMMDKDFYKNKAENKIRICKNNGVKLISLFEKDIKNLKIIFEDYILLTKPVTTERLSPVM